MSVHLHPRIAILSATNISVSTATGSLLYRLFQDWEAAQIMQIAKHWSNDEASTKFAQNVDFQDFMQPWQQSNNLVKRLPAAFLRRVFFPLKFSRGNKKRILAQLCKWKVEILYLRVVDEPYYYLELALFLQKELQIPLVTHVMDDFDLRLQYYAQQNFVKRYISKRYQGLLRQVFAVASLNFAISGRMKTGFEERYQVPFLVAHNGIKAEELAYYQKAKISKSATAFRLVWAGSIAETKDNEIIYTIIEAIRLVNEQSPKKPVELLLNVPKFNEIYAKQLSDNESFITYQTYQPLAQYRQMLASANLLLIGRNFDERAKTFTQYSFHNKLPDFLASGTPVLAIGPDWDNTVQLFQQYGWGYWLTDNSSEVIAEKIAWLIANYAKAQANVLEKRVNAYEHLSLSSIRANFTSAIKTLIYQT